MPPFPAFEADEEDEGQAEAPEFDYELPELEWRAIQPVEAPGEVPIRFIDGSIVSRVTGDLVVDGQHRPLIAATLSAACLEIEGGEMRRTGHVVGKLLCLHHNGIDPEDLDEAAAILKPFGIDLKTSLADKVTDFDTMRRSTRSIAMAAMEDAERDVLHKDLTLASLVDGLLERRIDEHQQDVPVVGLVKRQVVTYLPLPLQDLAYNLRCGERTPAFVMRLGRDAKISVVNCYVRLSDEQGTSPSYGIVRMTVPRAYLERWESPEARSAYLSGLAGYVYRLRHRDFAYDRAGISIEPIVRVEEDLHALRPDVEDVVWKLSRLLRPAEVPIGAV